LRGRKDITWVTPLLFISFTVIAYSLIAGAIKSQANSSGDVSLPDGWQWWTTEMQNNYMQAIQATQSPTFVYVIPAITSLTNIWITWYILGAMIHLASTLLGGRGTMNTALVFTSWASLPFAMRDIFRIIFMLIEQRVISSPGLSGFISAASPGGLFLANLFKNLDVFSLWQIFLLALGVRIFDILPRGRSFMGVLVTVIILGIARAALATLFTNLGSMIITRPIF